ncbi:DUF4347 domain-containing protein [Nisaea sediminum]|uniref:DUF4347 domain-containing protein n=1 Tax=Nisaea sediminum TaxID=2775867 RepID=UPI0018683B06|nr:DUF4347 domain-containing protein [Nisaea sediminum]
MSAYGIASDSNIARTTGPDEMLVLVDHRVPDAEFLLAALAVPSIAGRVGPEEGGLERLREMIEKAPRRPVIVICHGAPGALILGMRTITADDLRARRETLARIRKALSGAPVFLYACSVGEGLVGRTFLAMLAAGFDAPVSAASRPVGDAEKGGTWVLDVTVSTDPARLAPSGAPQGWPFDPVLLPAYRYLLAR